MILFVVGVFLLSRLGQSDFAFPLDSDFRSIEMAEWRNFFSNFTPLSKPRAYVYLDGQLIINGLVGVGLRAVASAIRPLREWFPNNDAYGVASALIVNIASYAAACVLLYASMLRAGANVPIAAAAAVAMLLSPQILNVELLRQDFLIALPMMAVFYCSVVLARGKEQTRHAVVLGLALGLLATLKLTGPMFGILPVFALTTRPREVWAARWPMLRFIGVALAVFAAVYVLLMGRFVYYFTLAEWLSLYPTGVSQLTAWSEMLPWEFSLFYNIDLVRGHGTEFIILYVTCTLVLAIVAIRERDGTAAFLVLSLVVYSIYSAQTMKYNRGGYHLIPLFIAVIAYSAAWLWRGRRLPALRHLLLATIALVMASSLSKSYANYNRRVLAVQESSASIGDLWRPALRWLQSNVNPADRLCIEIFSEWTLPVLGMLRQTKYGPFDHPFTSSERLSRHEPPDDDRLRGECDFLAIENFHQVGTQTRRRQANPQNAERWAAYFRDLPDRFPRVRFQTKHRAWPIQWIEIYSIRPLASK